MLTDIITHNKANLCPLKHFKYYIIKCLKHKKEHRFMKNKIFKKLKIKIELFSIKCENMPS